MSEQSPPILVQINIGGLFGRFDHTIDIAPTSNFCIVVGPNGVGKTKLLELANAAITWQLHKLLRVRFDHLILRFSDSASFTFSQVHQQQLPGIGDSESASVRSLQLWADTPSAPSAEVPLFADEVGGRDAFRLLEMLMESAPDSSTRRLLAEYRHRSRTTAELVALLNSGSFSDLLPEIEGEIWRAPDTHKEYFGVGRSYLIETQRLVRMEPGGGINDATPRGRVSDSQRMRSAVVRHASDLARRIGTLDAQSGRLGQTLDRTFPRRLLDRSRSVRQFNEIEADYERQRELRSRLEAIGLLDPQRGGLDTLDLRPDLDDTEQRVLQTWLEDGDKKLEIFTDLLAKVELFQSVLNEKFLYKSIEIDRESGFRAVSANGEEIPLSQLSSGEQHELVLLYDLLFNVSGDSLVMIDEPELSLHVSWQRRFIEDMIRVSHLRRNRFIVATHSPSIIDQWGDSVVELAGGWNH